MKVSYLVIIAICLLVSVQSDDCFVGEYYSGVSKRCEQCDISCSTCASAEGCSTCYDQMYLSTVGNKIICKVCYQLNNNCEKCISAQKCSQCTNGYYVNANNTCSPCSDFVSNCAFCKQNGTEKLCISCNYPYIKSNGRCVDPNTGNPSPPNSGSSSTQGSSSTSSSSNSPTGTSSQGQQQTLSQGQASPPNVQQSSSISVGGIVKISCQSNEVIVNELCILAIPFCLEYNLTTYKCSSCTKDCVISEFGYCVPVILLMNAQNQSKSGSNQNGLASNGISNSELKINNETDTNVTEKDCLQNQYFWYGQCVTIGTECSNRTTDGVCHDCIKGYLLKNNLCIQIPPPKAVDSTKASDKTVSSSQSDSSKKVCSNPCLTCQDGDQNYCLTCVEGFTTVDVFPGRCFKLN